MRGRGRTRWSAGQRTEGRDGGGQRRGGAEERQRGDRLNKQVEALLAELTEKRAEAVVGRAERAEAGRGVERARADALHTTIEELKAGQALMTVMHTLDLLWPSTTPWRRSRRPRRYGRPRPSERRGAGVAAQGGVAAGVKRPGRSPLSGRMQGRAAMPEPENSPYHAVSDALMHAKPAKSRRL
jgi:hypothetical protein